MLISSSLEDTKVKSENYRGGRGMIIVERFWDEFIPGESKDSHNVKRRCFSDWDYKGVEEFLNEAPLLSDWRNVEYKFTKL